MSRMCNKCLDQLLSLYFDTRSFVNRKTTVLLYLYMINNNVGASKLHIKLYSYIATCPYSSYISDLIVAS